MKCLEYSPLSGKQEGFLNSIPKGEAPFQTIHIDHYGPLEKCSRGYKHVFAVVDAFTKFIKLFPCKSTGTDEVINHLVRYFSFYSKPRRIIADRGTAFTSNAFKEFINEEAIDLVLIATGTPRSNGQIERFNRCLTPMIAKTCRSPEKWDEVIPIVEFSLNNTICRSINETPSRVLFGVDQQGTVNVIFSNTRRVNSTI